MERLLRPEFITGLRISPESHFPLFCLLLLLSLLLLAFSVGPYFIIPDLSSVVISTRPLPPPVFRPASYSSRSSFFYVASG